MEPRGNGPSQVTLAEVKTFWEQHPLLSRELSTREPGTPQFFAAFDRIREEAEKYSLHLFNFALYQGRKVLDVGCGNGWLLSHYARSGAEVTGLDLTETATHITRRRFQLLGLRGRFLVANAEQLPFADGVFDLVTSLGVIHHTPNTEACAQEMMRVAKPEGRIVCAVYYRNALLRKGLYPLVQMIMWASGLRERAHLPLEDQIRRFDGPDNPLGKAYSKGEVMRMFGSLAEVRTEVHYFPARLIFRRWAPKLPSPVRKLLDRYLGFLLYLSGRKL